LSFRDVIRLSLVLQQLEEEDAAKRTRTGVRVRARRS